MDNKRWWLGMVLIIAVIFWAIVLILLVLLWSSKFDVVNSNLSLMQYVNIFGTIVLV